MKIKLEANEVTTLLAALAEGSEAKGFASAKVQECVALQNKNRDLEDRITDLVRENERLKANPSVVTSSEVMSAKLGSIFRLAKDGQKIQAIKQVRSWAGCGLKEAKEIVEGNYQMPLNDEGSSVKSVD